MLPKPPVPISITLHRHLSPLAARIDAVLPQTQCQRCGYPACADYASAISTGEADINQCPPGGDEGITMLATLTDRPVKALNPVHGDITPLRLAKINPELCIGCTLCLQACPVDAILGANKRMHTVLEKECSGCELCLPVCPVDCISLYDSQPVWAAIPEPTSARWRTAHQAHLSRYWQEPEPANTKVDFLAQALARAKKRVGETGK